MEVPTSTTTQEDYCTVVSEEDCTKDNLLFEFSFAREFLIMILSFLLMTDREPKCEMPLHKYAHVDRAEVKLPLESEDLTTANSTSRNPKVLMNQNQRCLFIYVQSCLLL